LTRELRKSQQHFESEDEDYRNLIAATEDLAVEETMTVWYEVPFRSKEVLSIKFYIKSYLKAEDYTDITIDSYVVFFLRGEYDHSSKRQSCR